MYETLLYERSGAVATITLNRPAAYNACNEAMTRELGQALAAVAGDDTVRVLVLTGAGDKAFCSGQDLKEPRSWEARAFSDSLRRRYNPLILALRRLQKPVICRLNGVAAGAGCSLALACDVIVASATATLAELFVHIALVPDSGSTHILARTLGYHRAFQLAARGERLTAAEAQRLGFVRTVVPPAGLDAAVREEADYYAAAPTKAIGLIKTMLQKAAELPLEAALEYEAYAQQIAGGTADHSEGKAAFLEKRKPVFRGC